ncbi:hypothetical protein [Caballeronia glebae]|uniref:hypothetical protein n=1 Tax=Caballeronia glebae TaxID=1777143 RepID=UPI0038B73768
MSTLFVVQNDTHAKNFNIMAREAVARGEAVSILLLDGATHESTQRFFDESLNPLIRHVEQTSNAFYRSGNMCRARTCLQFRAWARETIGTFDHVVLGNDGALQKIIVKAARARSANCRVSVVLDGLLTREKGLRALTKRRLQRLAENLNLDALFPSTVGISCLIDDITVMHTSVADVLRFHGSKAQDIVVAPLPRHAAIRATARRYESGKTRILFLGGAYLWHNEQVGHSRQVEDFSAFCEFATRSTDVECRLRIHPRDDISIYRQLDSARLQVGGSGNSLEHDLAWADIVVASRSSGLFDAMLAGRRVFVYTAHFPLPNDDTFFSSLPSVSTFEELRK